MGYCLKPTAMSREDLTRGKMLPGVERHAAIFTVLKRIKS